MQLLDSEIFIVTKIRGYTHQLSTSRKIKLWLMTKQPSRLRQSRFSTAWSFLSVCRYSPRYNNPLLLFVFFQAQAWGVGCCNSFSDCSADIQLDLSANMPFLVYLAMSNHPALVNKSELECHAVHWHDRHYFCWCAGHCDFPIPVNDLT